MEKTKERQRTLLKNTLEKLSKTNTLIPYMVEINQEINRNSLLIISTIL